MVPLVLVAGLVSVFGPNPSSWLFTANPPSLLSSVTSSTGASGAVTTPSEVKQREGLVVVAVDNRAGENVISDDTHFNLSSTPPFSVQAIQTPQQQVRAFSSFITIIQPLSLPFLSLYKSHYNRGRMGQNLDTTLLSSYRIQVSL